MAIVQKGSQQLQDLVRALEIVQVYDDAIDLDPPEEIDSDASLEEYTGTATSGPTQVTESVEQEPDTKDEAVDKVETSLSAFNATTDITDYFHVNETDCAFSSDPTAPLCDITAFRCTNSQTYFTVRYDYEIHYPTSAPSNLSHLIQVIEGSMMDQVAAEMKLKNCAKSFRGRRLQAGYSDDQLDRFTGISRLPKDEMTTDECLVKLEGDAMDCRSVKGALSVYTLQTSQDAGLSHQLKLELKEAVLGRVQRGMVAGQYLTSQNDEKVVFIGDRDALLTTESTTNSGMSSLSVGLISAACVLVLVIVAGVCFLRRRLLMEKGAQYLPDTSSCSVGSEPRQENAPQTNANSLGPQDGLSLAEAQANSITESATSWSRSDLHEQGTACIEFDRASQSDDSALNSFEVAATFDHDAITETPTDLGNYQFSYDQGISPMNETFDNLYDDVEVPMTFDDASRCSAGSRRSLGKYGL